MKYVNLSDQFVVHLIFLLSCLTVAHIFSFFQSANKERKSKFSFSDSVLSLIPIFSVRSLFTDFILPTDSVLGFLFDPN